MDISEKIKKKREQMETCKKRIASDQTKIETLQKEVSALEALEIKALLKEVDMPFDEVKVMLKKMKSSSIVPS